LEGRRGDDYKNGVDISFEIPLFDWGTARVARAESIYMQSVNRAAQVATNAQSEIRSAYYSYRTSYDIAKHYRDEIVPLRKKILDENQLRYNGMLVGPFELLAEARAQVSSVKNYIDALREFWVAESTLQMSLIGSHEMKAGE
jgi:outer membrane protein TolC